MMNKNLTNKLNEADLAATTGGVTESSDDPKYSVGDVVEVTFPLCQSWTNRGTITEAHRDSETWRYHIHYEDWFMIDGWVSENRIASKVY